MSATFSAKFSDAGDGSFDLELRVVANNGTRGEIERAKILYVFVDALLNCQDSENQPAIRQALATEEKPG